MYLNQFKFPLFVKNSLDLPNEQTCLFKFDVKSVDLSNWSHRSIFIKKKYNLNVYCSNLLPLFSFQQTGLVDHYCGPLGLNWLT